MPTYQCPDPDCTASFPLKKTLYRHFRTKHGWIQYFDCAICGDRFTRKDVRARHIREQHSTGNGTVQCAICGRHVRKRNLADHLSSQACRREWEGIQSNAAASIPYRQKGNGSLSVIQWSPEKLDGRLSDIRIPPLSRTLQANSQLLASVSSIFCLSGMQLATGRYDLQSQYWLLLLRLRGFAMRSIVDSLGQLSVVGARIVGAPELYISILALSYLDFCIGGAEVAALHLKALRTLEDREPGQCSIDSQERLTVDAANVVLMQLPSAAASIDPRLRSHFVTNITPQSLADVPQSLVKVYELVSACEPKQDEPTPPSWNWKSWKVLNPTKQIELTEPEDEELDQRRQQMVTSIYPNAIETQNDT